MGALRIRGALVIGCLAGCSTGPAPVHTAACAPVIWSTVRSQGVDLPYVELSNDDSGLPGSCGGDPEVAVILLGPDRPRVNSGLMLVLPLPLATGSRSIAVRTGPSGGFDGVLDLTSVHNAADGPYVDGLEGTLSGAASGSFRVHPCTVARSMCF